MTGNRPEPPRALIRAALAVTVALAGCGSAAEAPRPDGSHDVFCGNGVLDNGEACDNGGANSDSVPDACRSDCTLSRCGDGVADSAEGCDDGNELSGDGCAQDCRNESARWVQLATASMPSARSGHAIAYDGARDRLVLFGGFDRIAGMYLGDTWEFDGVDWRSVAAVTSPPPRSGHAAAYDHASASVVVFGGRDATQARGDTWLWDGAVWTDVASAGPPARTVAGFACTEAECLLFGGDDGLAERGDTWSWDGAAWRELTPPASPGARIEPTLVLDPASQSLVLVGGWDRSSFVVRPEMWRWTSPTWQALSPVGLPTMRIGQVVVPHSRRGALVLMGGLDIMVAPSFGTWEYVGGAWQNVWPGFGPSPRSYAAAAYDSTRHRVVLFGGDDGTTDFGDTWEFKYSTN